MTFIIEYASSKIKEKNSEFSGCVVHCGMASNIQKTFSKVKWSHGHK